MDDIDDILASVDRDTLSVPQAAALDHQILTRFWVAERGAPELLPWPEKLMERVMGRVGKQVCLFEATRARYISTRRRRMLTVNIFVCVDIYHRRPFALRRPVLEPESQS
jgi:hypothetical protein